MKSILITGFDGFVRKNLSKKYKLIKLNRKIGDLNK